MNNDALVAALGLDAVAAVHGYRLAVLAEAERRGLPLISAPLSDVVPVSDGKFVMIDPIDIRLAFVRHHSRRDLTGRTLTWGPAHGWSISQRGGSGPRCYYASPGAAPLDLVPTPSQVLDWAAGEPAGGAVPPSSTDLDDEPAAIHRLLSFIESRCRVAAVDAFAPVVRGTQDRP